MQLWNENKSDILSRYFHLAFPFYWLCFGTRNLPSSPPRSRTFSWRGCSPRSFFCFSFFPFPFRLHPQQILQHRHPAARNHDLNSQKTVFSPKYGAQCWILLAGSHFYAYPHAFFAKKRFFVTICTWNPAWTLQL